jgi:hypothetical protein
MESMTIGKATLFLGDCLEGIDAACKRIEEVQKQKNNQYTLNL